MDVKEMIERLELLESHIAMMIAEEVREIIELLKDLDDKSTWERAEALRAASNKLDQLKGLAPHDMEEVDGFAAELMDTAEALE